MSVAYKKQWNFLRNKFESGQLAHAYLFAGQEGIGKTVFAKEFIEMINCLSRADKRACKKCFSCQAIERNSFPDLKIIEKEQGKKEIEILQVREAQKFLNYKSYYGSFKALVVNEAEKMSQEAQSCFLKTLEEPRGKSLVILITSKPDMLLATINSRCQTIKFLKNAEFPENKEKAAREKKILKILTPVLNANFSEKFKYVKSLDFSPKGGPASGGEQYSPLEIITAMENYFRKQLLDDFSDKKSKKILELTEEISNKLLFTNANPKLALEVLLMEI